jgi:hypothetical protein
MLAGIAKDVKSLTRRSSAIPHPSHEESDESDVEEVAQKLSKRENRVLWLESVREIHPDLPHPQPPVEKSSRHFQDFVPKTNKTIMAFCPMLAEELSKASQARKPNEKKKDPFRTVERFYKTLEPVESTILQSRMVPTELLNEVHPSNLQNPGASGAEARLKADSAHGQKEAAALKEHKRAAAFLRLINSQEIATQAIGSMNESMVASLNALLQRDDVSAEVRHSLEAMQGNAQTTMSGIADLQMGSTHLARCAITQYIDAVRDRQVAWIKLSSLPVTLQAELQRSELSQPQGTSTEPLSLLGPQAEKMVKDHVSQRKDDMFRGWYNTRGRGTSGAARRRQTKKKAQKQQSQEVSFAGQAAGWSTQPIQAQRGRGGRGRGRGRRQRRGGHSQPFSKSEASTSGQ